MKSLSSKTYQCGVTIQGLTTLSGTVYLTGITNTASWDHVIVGTTAQGQIYTRTYAQFMGDVAAGISLSSYVTGSGTTNYLPKFTGGSALGNSQIFDNGTNVGIGTASPLYKLDVVGAIRSNASNVGILNLGTDSYSSTYLTTQVIGQTSPSYTSTGKLSFKVLTWGAGSDYGPTEQMYIDVTGPDTKTATLVMLPWGGNVGIGTSSPSEKLHLYGTGNQLLKVENTGTYLMYVGLLSNEGYIGSTNATPLGFYTNNVNRIYINTSGNVGIGTTSPAYKFQVAGGDIAIDFNRYLRGGSGGDWNLVNLYNGATGDMEITMLNASWYLRHNANASFAGSVGIGTTSPSQKLDVNGYAKFTSGIILDGGATSHYREFIWNTSGFNRWDLYVHGAEPGSNVGGDLFLARYADNGAYLANAVTFQRSTGNVGIGTTSPATELQVNGTARATRLNSTGGTVDFDAQTGNNFIQIASSIVSIANGGNVNMTITSAGNVGIGTTSPTGKLQIADDGPNALVLGSTQISTIGETNDGGYPGMKIVPYNSNIHIGISSTNDNKINLWYGGNNYTYWQQLSAYSVISNYSTNALVFQVNGGNVGIGTTSPVYKLDVNGIGNFSNGFSNPSSETGYRLKFYDNGGTYNDTGIGLDGSGGGGEIMWFNALGGFYWGLGTGGTKMKLDSSGNLGIGTTTPSTLLDVSGVITATGGNSTNWNTAYGWGNHASANYVPQARTLTINGTSYDLSANRSWTIATTTPGGSDTQFQYNSSGSLAGASALTYNSTTNRVGINQASPGYDLDVNGQVRVQDKLRVGTGNGVVHMSSTATINASGTTVVWAQNVSVGMCAFIEYYILNNNSLTDQRAGTIMVTWNQSGTPTITHTETTTPDIGSTTTVNFTSSLVGSDARINAVNSSANPYTMVMSFKYF